MKRHIDAYKKELLETIFKVAKNKSLLNDFIKDILTSKEMENISTRWQIVRRLAKGEHHQNIAEDLGLGVATVTRGSREMRKKEGGFRRALRFLKLD